MAYLKLLTHKALIAEYKNENKRWHYHSLKNINKLETYQLPKSRPTAQSQQRPEMIRWWMQNRGENTHITQIRRWAYTERTGGDWVVSWYELHGYHYIWCHWSYMMLNDIERYFWTVSRYGIRMRHMWHLPGQNEAQHKIHSRWTPNKVTLFQVSSWRKFNTKIMIWNHLNWTDTLCCVKR
jgi:hypothetical protein